MDHGTAPRFTKREDRFSKTTPSLASYYENLEVEEWIQSVAGVLDQGWNDQYAFLCSSQPSSKHITLSLILSRPFLTLPLPLYKNPLSNSRRAASQRPLRHYEFPTGFNTYFGPERFQVGELYFAHSRELVVRPIPISLLHSPFSFLSSPLNTQRQFRHQIHTSHALSPH